MMSKLILFTIFLCFVSDRVWGESYLEEKLRLMKSMEETKWANMKTLIEEQNLRFNNFEQSIADLSRRLSRMTGSDQRSVEICVTPGKGGNEYNSRLRESKDHCPDDWKSSRGNKCYKFFNVAKNFADALAHCKSNAPHGYKATLASINDPFEQQLVERYLFRDHNPNKDVWLGGQKFPSNATLEWDDTSNNKYTNYDKTDVPTATTNCVKMRGKYFEGKKLGEWKSTQCFDNNLVLCSATPSSLPSKYPGVSKQLFETAETLPLTDNHSSVPYGFIYIQLPSQLDPRTLWPQYDWTDISYQYPGEFFRVEGGGSEPFGFPSQRQSVPRILVEQHKKSSSSAREEQIEVPNDGSWSDYVFTGGYSYSDRNSEGRYLRFKLSNDELRPKNQAVRVWKRA